MSKFESGVGGTTELCLWSDAVPNCAEHKISDETVVCSDCGSKSSYLKGSVCNSLPVNTQDLVNNWADFRTSPAEIVGCTNKVEGCSACLISWICTGCSNGRGVTEDGKFCLSSCNPGKFLTTTTPKKCLKCAENCAACVSSTSDCESCDSGYRIYNGECVPENCIQPEKGLTSTLVPSLDGISCVVCSSLFPNCEYCNENGCTQCSSGYFLEIGKGEVTSCQDESSAVFSDSFYLADMNEAVLKRDLAASQMVLKSIYHRSFGFYPILLQ